MAQGWISVHRKIKDCDLLWKDKPFSRGQAWIDLLLMVNHEEKEIIFNGSYRKIERGQTLTSVVKLSEQWGWSRKKTTNFLNALKMAQMIDLKSDNRSTTVTVINYGFYQDVGAAKEQQKSSKRTSEEHQRNTNNNVLIMSNKEINNVEQKSSKEKDIEEIVSYLNEKANKGFKPKSKATQKHILGRLNEGYTIEDFKSVIDTKTSQWGDDPKMSMYLRPETLFIPGHFESYLNEAPKKVVVEKEPEEKIDLEWQRSFFETEEEWKEYLKNEGLL